MTEAACTFHDDTRFLVEGAVAASRILAALPFPADVATSPLDRKWTLPLPVNLDLVLTSYLVLRQHE